VNEINLIFNGYDYKERSIT